MTRKQVKDFTKEFKSLNNQIQALLIKYGAGPGSFYVNAIGIKDIDFENEEQDEIEKLINPLPEEEAKIDVFYATNVTDEDELEEILDNVYYAHSSEMAKERKERIMRKTPPEKGSTTASDWINLN
jgi:hypothetical protein